MVFKEKISEIKKICTKPQILLFVLVLPALVVFADYGSEAPVITNIKVSEVEEDKVVIDWETNVNTDATVNYGLNQDHGLMRYPLFDKKKHKIIVDELEPSTTYFFRVASSDEYGNKTTSGGFVFSTKSILEDVAGIEKIGDEKEKALVEKTLTSLGKITSEEGISIVAQEVGKAVGDILGPPSIMGLPRISVGSDYADIEWFTDRDSNSMVHFVPENEYDPNSSEPYTLFQGNPNDLVLEHAVRIIGLEPATMYHYKVVSEDQNNLTGESRDFVFTTKSILPEIRNVRITKIQETSATVAWNTDVPASGLVEYTNTRTKLSKSSGDPAFATSHSVNLQGLEFGTKYSAIIKSVNASGDEIVSKPFTFVTVKDEYPPLISKVKNESTLFPGSDTKIQTIIAWETDEQAYCQFFYAQGIISGNEDQKDFMPKELDPQTKHTQVVVGFAPATVYRFWMECEDLAGNGTKSEDFVLFTPQKEKSIIDIIIENFEGTFGWVKNISN